MAESKVTTAKISWDNHNHPYSSMFNDHYYSQSDGLAESQHVFINGNQLHTRWIQHKKHYPFCIMETGFGSGLNFLATWKLWQSMGLGKEKKLHYISVERYPLNKLQLAKSLLNWADSLSSLSKKLLDNYPLHYPETHHIKLEEDNITLTLLFSDIRELMPDLDGPKEGLVDAWFLDGFAPSRNPQMWQPELYEQMHRLSRKGATVATYTVAGMVRRGLISAGFEIYRKPGFATKREMLTAIKA